MMRACSQVYHAIINGYLGDAKSRGYRHAHIWVQPPQPGDEYIFSSRPVDPVHRNRPMSMAKLRSWYERMLRAAQARDQIERRPRSGRDRSGMAALSSRSVLPMMSLVD